jgi:hypothetical protein
LGLKSGLLFVTECQQWIMRVPRESYAGRSSLFHAFDDSGIACFYRPEICHATLNPSCLPLFEQDGGAHLLSLTTRNLASLPLWSPFFSLLLCTHGYFYVRDTESKYEDETSTSSWICHHVVCNTAFFTGSSQGDITVIEQ